MRKLESFLFYIFVFLIPLQTRITLFSWGDRFIEWNSAFLYLTDLLLIGIFILWIRRLAWRRPVLLGGRSVLLLLSFFIITSLSLLVSQSINVSIYQLIKLAEFILLFLYIKYNLKFLKLDNILKIVIASGVLQSLLAIAQFFKQSSLGLKYIEAGIFNANIPGVATFFADGSKFIRAYGTFPHPNVLAVFLLFSIFCIYKLWKSDFHSLYKVIVYIPSFMLLTLGLFLTFSRAVILVFIVFSLLLFLITFLKFKESRKKILSLVLIFAIGISLWLVVLWPEMSDRFLGLSTKEQAVTLRVYYNDTALSIIKKTPLLGVGVGGFVPHLLENYNLREAWLYQPVHNIYLLIASEIGILGLLVFLIFIGLNVWKSDFLRKSHFSKLAFVFLVVSFLALALIDHYFWTIQQGRILFWITLAITSSLVLESKNKVLSKK